MKYYPYLPDKDTFEGYFKSLELRHASYVICIGKMASAIDQGRTSFKFFVNPYKLVYLADQTFQNLHADKNFQYLDVSISDFKSYELGVLRNTKLHELGI